MMGIGSVFSKIGSVLKAVAPTLAMAIPIPGVGGIAVKAISQALLGKPEGTENELTKAIANATPEQLLALKTADNQFKLDMAKLDIDVEKVAEANRESARNRDIEVRKLNSGKNRRADILSYIAVVSLISLIYTLIFTVIKDPSTRELIALLIGALTVIVKDVYGFEFATTRGSREKDERISAATK